MAVSRRLRFEILRRDAFTCRYCGASDIPLTVDHVVPTTLGGSDEPSNLVTACQPCNAGKSSIAPDAPIVENVSDAALRWAAAMREAADIQLQRRDERQRYINALDEVWSEWWIGSREHKKPIWRPDDWANSIGRFHDLGLPLELVLEAASAALRNQAVRSESTWRYFCGICWSHVREQQELAQQLLREAPE